MKALIQRVTSASVSIDGTLFSAIGKGLLVFVGIGLDDTIDDVEKLCIKIPKLRIFSDDQGLMNLSSADIDGDFLIVSQFTLHAETKKGNRPSYIKSARPEQALDLFNRFIDKLEIEVGKEVKKGKFGADMQVELINDGPVTIMIDTKNWE